MTGPTTRTKKKSNDQPADLVSHDNEGHQVPKYSAFTGLPTLPLILDFQSGVFGGLKGDHLLPTLLNIVIIYLNIHKGGCLMMHMRKPVTFQVGDGWPLRDLMKVCQMYRCFWILGQGISGRRRDAFLL